MANLVRDHRFLCPSGGAGGPVFGTIYWPDASTDAAPNTGYLLAASAYAQATGANRTGGSLFVGAGLGSRVCSCVSVAAGVVSITITVNGSAVTLQSGVDFALGANTTATATNLAAAILANTTLAAQCTPTASTTFVYIQPKETCYALLLATTNAAAIDVTMNSDGQIALTPDGSATRPILTFGSDTDLGLYRYGANVLGIAANGALAAYIATTGVGIGDDFNFIMGASNDASLGYSTVQTPDSLVMGLPATSNALILCEVADLAQDFAHAAAAHPTLFIQSATAASTTHYIHFLHDDTTGFIGTGSGNLKLSPDSGFFTLQNGAGTSSMIIDVANGLRYVPSRTTDSLPPNQMFKSSSAYAQATGANLVGGASVTASGIGSRQFAVATPNVATSVSMTVNNEAIVTLSSTTHWALNGDATIQASNIASAINGHATLGTYLVATAVGAVIYLQPKETCFYCLLAVGNANMTATQSNDGITGVYGRVRLGRPGTPGLTTANAEVYVPGVLEVGSRLYMSGANSPFYVQGGIIADYGGGASITLASAAQTPDAIVIGVPVTSNGIIFCEVADRGYDFAHALQTNPTVFIQSANQSATEWLSLAHNQTDAVITSGKGHVKLVPAAGSSVMCADGTAAAPGVRLLSEAHGLYRVGATAMGVSIAGAANGYFDGGGFVAEATGYFAFSARSVVNCPANGQLRLRNSGDTTGVLFDVTTDSVLSLRNRGDTAPATLQAGGVTLNEGMLATVASVDLSAAGKTTLYTVPAGKTAVITRVIVRNASADISAATHGFGGDANATDWMAAQDLTALTAADDAIMLHPSAGTLFKVYAAATAFGMKPTVAEGAADTVTVSVFGYLV